MRRTLLALTGFLCLLNVALAQTRQLTGKVVGPDNQGVVSATVKVKGGTAVTVANAEGIFSLAVPTGNLSLEVSSIGFVTREVAVGADENNITVSLAAEVSQLTDVVVTALGITKQARKVGYAVTSVNGDLMNKARENNIGNSLSGRVAGLKVAGTSSGPQGTVKMLLRGLPSMNSPGTPLIVINGIPMDNTQRGSAGEWGGGDNGDGIGNLNPDDIENMTVLKGQSASALYGARASNGVILITTKSGKRNDFSVDYNMNYMVEQAIDFTDFQYVYGQGLNGAKPTTAALAQQTGRQSWGAKLDGSSVIQYDGKSYPYSAVQDNIKNFYRNGPSLTNTVALSKGGSNGSFRMSYSNLQNEAILRNSGVTRNTVNLNVQQDITNKLQLSFFGTYIDQNNKNVPYLSDGPLNANNGMFLATNINQQILSPGYDPATGYEIQFSDDEYVSNPWFVVNQFVNNVGRKRLTSATTLKYNFTKWLYAQGRFGYDLMNDENLNVTPWGTAYSQQRRGGLGSQGKSQSYELNADVLVGASQSITKDLTVDVAVGGNLRKNEYEAVSISGGPFILPYLYTISNTQNRNTSYGFSKTQVNSGYYTADFSYKNFLTLGTTGRYDAYSTLPEGNNSIFVPSVFGSFIFSELLNMKNLNFGKLRAAFAQTSNELTTPYQTDVYYSLNNSYLGVPVGSFPTSLPSGLLKPFTTTELEFGLEMKMFGNRLGIDLAYFQKKTKNEIMAASYSIATGFTSGFLPNGSTENKGLELQITGGIIRKNNFSWDLTFNMTNVSNKVLETDPAGNRVNLGQNRATLGNAITAYVKGMAGPQIMAYDYKYDSKGQVIVNSSGHPVRGDLVPMGSVLPTLYGGINNDLRYKNLTFSFLIDYNYGNNILSATNYYAMIRGLHQMTLEGRETGITTGVYENGTPNTVAATPQGYYTALAQNVTKLHVMDGDFIKLRQLTLGYNFPASILKSLKIIQALNISLVARNLAVLMKKTDNIDPESTFGSNVRYYGIEGTSLPSTRAYGVNVNIKFKK
ncbi:MAG: SusC/RagA family TonB-linked outer membrane protein [Chitinophagaceae bacterium]|nr:SusC/RagA family TonB-linked outer membrane protein [Chitinophagaceae bacterium]